MLTILFDGIAYGMLLFVLACGLSVTLGLMNFVNLAHGAFAMAGGYVTVILVNRWRLAVLRRLPARLPVVAPPIGALLERTLYRHLYDRPHLDQVLFTIGLVFMAVAAVDYVMGSQQIFIQPAGDAAGPDRPARRRHRPLPAVHHRASAALLTLRLQFDPDQDALRQPACAPRWTTSAWRAGSASMSTPSSR